MAKRSNSLNSRTVLLALATIVMLVIYLNRERIFAPNSTTSGLGPGEYLFCVWNVENLFDDKYDKRHKPDDEYDSWFAENAADRELKYKHLSEALLRMNGGRGPDIIALVEVESVRAAELLRDELNANLPAGAVPYGEVHMKEVAVGRHIAPAVLTRLKVTKTKGFGKDRLLHVNVEVGGQELVVLTAHWTSQMTDKTGDKRDRYADLCYGTANEVFHANPRADILVCGDFNDVPDSREVVERLHAGADRAAVSGARNGLAFLDLMAGKDPKQYGTHFYGNRPLIYDHICISPGLLDNAGWSCDPDSVHAVSDGLIRPGVTQRHPWRFGNRKDDQHRGYSDHFPVTVKLKVNAP